MVLLVTYPLYVATGLLMWLTHLAILSWLLHFFMAVINPSSRVGLQGMISGFVDGIGPNITIAAGTASTTKPPGSCPPIIRRRIVFLAFPGN